jgi:hypothetical protein
MKHELAGVCWAPIVCRHWAVSLGFFLLNLCSYPQRWPLSSSPHNTGGDWGLCSLTKQHSSTGLDCRPVAERLLSPRSWVRFLVLQTTTTTKSKPLTLKNGQNGRFYFSYMSTVLKKCFKKTNNSKQKPVLSVSPAKIQMRQNKLNSSQALSFSPDHTCHPTILWPSSLRSLELNSVP